MGLTIIAIIFCIILAVISLTLQMAEVAMLSFGGAFLTTVCLWVFVTGHIVDKSFRSQDKKMAKTDKTLVLSISLIIYVMILAIFLSGDTIAWWRVRVNQQSYDIAGVIVPKALTTVTTTFFTSILLLTWSTFRKVANKSEELRKAELNNENPLTLLERRENDISTIINNVGKKGVIFVLIMGFTIIFSSDLNMYANQVILLAIPFSIAAIVTLIILSFYWKKQTSPIQLVLDKIMKCPECGNKTPLGGTYCEQCGHKIVLEERFSNGVLCEKCYEVNTEDSKYCRYCEEEFKGRKLKKI